MTLRRNPQPLGGPQRMPGRAAGPILSAMPQTHVLVAGGGFAAGEVLLALRALAGERVTLELVTPDLSLPLRPAATTLPFPGGAMPTYDLRVLAESVGARVRTDAIEAVAPQVRRVRLASGGTAAYDALVLAVGARARVAVPGAVTFRDQRDAGRLAQIADDLRTGAAKSLAIAIPPGTTWSLPAYELALQAARHGEVTVVTPEQEPLEVFGRPASSAVSSLLSSHEVRVLRASPPREADGAGVQLAFGGSVRADRVVAMPSLVGRRIAGVPAGFGGFVPVGGTGRVDELEDVWAAGDMTAFPVKQGGLATQQADVAAEDIAALAGARERPSPARYTLRAKLVGAERPLYLRTELDATGRPLDSTAAVDTEPPWWPPAKVVGRYLTPWMAEQSLTAA
jgi:sulfide:quinone oxidoreductase